MSRLALAIIAITTACAPWVGAPDAERSTVRVMTWNIHAGQDLDRASNLERVAAFIDSVGADVVLLQEVDRNTARSQRVDQPAVLARLTGMHVEFARALDFDGGEYGIAILSRNVPVAVEVVPLEIVRAPELAERYYEPRTALHIALRFGDDTLHVVNTHVDHQSDPVFRHLQLIELMAYVADAVPSHSAVVLGGDLNARPAAAGVRALGIRFDDAWTQCGDGGAGFTFSSAGPDRRIDYIKLSNATCRSARVMERTYSDHMPLVVDVVMR